MEPGADSMKYVEEPASDEVHRKGNQGPIKEAFSLAPENVKDEGQTCISALVEVVHGGGAGEGFKLAQQENKALAAFLPPTWILEVSLVVIFHIILHTNCRHHL